MFWFDPRVQGSGVLLIRYWLPVLLWMGLIYSASTDTMSAGNTSRIIGPILRWFKPDISDTTIQRVQLVVRKAAHMTEYAVLSLLLWRARRQPRRNDPRPWEWRDAAFALAVAIAYALTDELHQTIVPSRQGQLGDVLIDSAGAALGLMALWAIGRRRRRW